MTCSQCRSEMSGEPKGGAGFLGGETVQWCSDACRGRWLLENGHAKFENDLKPIRKWIADGMAGPPPGCKEAASKVNEGDES